MFEKIRPSFDKVLIRRIAEEEFSAGGMIIIPDTAKKKGQRGLVLAVGPGKVTTEGKIIPVTFEKDDVVFFGQYSGTELSEEYLMISAEDILGVVEKENTLL